MGFVNLIDLPEKELVPGYHARFVHTENMTMAYWTIEAGAALPQHAHPHEQVTNLIEGEFELTVNGEARILTPGMVVVIPGVVPHVGRAIMACRIIDVFYPIREEYR